ncbi:MAG TPA: LamG-like jellyroll fold domain-containing protein [Pyrinomonadaceae bacterium]|nr:LamG-like jellyroll fold domain-containing protein [Pyrinomonadaceae bacterium]
MILAAFLTVGLLATGLIVARATSTDLRPLISDLWSSTIFATRTARTAPAARTLSPPAPVPFATTYTWNQTATASWATSTNWTPTRTTPAVDDILIFNNAATTTVTSVPTQTIGQLSVSGNTNVTLQAGATATLIIAGGTGTDLSVATGSQLNVNTAIALTINVATGATGSISGSMTLSAGAHRLTAVDASGITFNSGATFTEGTAFSGNPFGTTNLNSIVFASGSTFVFIAGSNPFGATQPSSCVVFQSGSLFSHQGSGTPSFNGRTYANFELNIAATTITVTGASAVSINDLTITAGTLNFNMTGTPGHAIKGNISVAAAGTLNFNPLTVGTVNLNGTSAQTISGAGTLTVALNQTIAITNAAGVSLSSGATLTLVGGAVTDSTALTVNGTLNCGTCVVSGAGNFTLASGGTLGIGSTAGITSTASSGNIQVAGARSYSATANYTYNGSANQAVGNQLPASVTNLTIANTGVGGSNTVTGNSGQTVTGLLRVQSGIYAGASTYNNVQIDSGATLSLDADATVSGNWTNNGGTLTANSHGVTFNGPTGQTINGNTSFYDFTKSVSSAQQFNFTNGSLTTVTHSLTLTGASGQLLSLRSTATGTQWNLNAPATQSVNFVNVQDSNASSGATVNATSSVDSTNNLNWSFGPSLVSIAVTPANASIALAATQQYTATGTFSDSSTRALVSGPATWSSKAAMPSARSWFTAASLLGEIYVVGGNNNGLVLSTVDAYNPVSNTWTSKPSTPTGRYDSASGVINNLLYVAGGCAGVCASNLLATMDAYDPATNAWTSRATMLTARFNARGAVIHGILYVLGGQNGNQTITYKTLEAYDPSTNTWTPKAPMTATRTDFSLAAVNGKLYAIGGYPLQTTVEAYDPGSNTWTTKAPLPTARSSMATATVKGKIVVAGGYDGAISNRVDIYDPLTDTWSSGANLPTARSTLSGAVTNGVFYALGGCVSCFPASTTNEAFDLGEVSWSSSNAAAATINLTGLATGVAYGSTTITATNDTISGNTNLTVAPQDMVFNSSGNLAAGTYHNVTINNCGTSVHLTGNVIITGTMTVNTCANLYTDTFTVSGAGAFVLASGGWLHITDANGITTAACGIGSTCGSIRTTTRSFSNTANYDYDGGTNQAVGNGLPSSVADLLISNTGGGGNNTVTGNSGQAAQLLQIIQGVYSSHSDYVDVDIQAAGTLSLAGPITVSGNWTNAGTFTPNGFGVTFDGTGTQTITTGGSGADKAFSGFTVTKSTGSAVLNGALSAATLSVTQGTFDTSASNFAVTVSGAVSLTGGTFTANCSAISVGGNWSNTAAFTAGTSTVTLNGSGNAQTISGNTTFANLMINHTGGGGVTAAGSTLSVTGLLRVQSGTFTSATAYNNVQIDSAGILALSGPITVSGNWTLASGGEFDANGFRVTFNGATGQTITGDTSFYDFTKSVTTAQQFNFTAGSLTTVTHSLTLNGASSQLLSLRSTSSGTQWKLHAPATQSVSFVDVKDSDASGGTLVTAANSTNSGNNINWFFGCPGTLIVNDTGDAGDESVGDGTCRTTGGVCTLRAAIQEANALSSCSGALTINFNITGGGVHTISPASALPTITHQVIIDGYTQGVASANTQANSDDAVLLIELDGTGASTATGGLSLSGPPSTIKGLVINRFANSSGFGIKLLSNGHTVRGNFIGTDPTGTIARPNGNGGVFVEVGISGNTIGGATLAARNLISGNSFDGIAINGPSNFVQGNFIGIDAGGTLDLGNTRRGVSVVGATNTIGGTSALARNVISGNDENGILITGGSTTGTIVQGNFIGTNALGTAAIANTDFGIEVDSGSTGNTIGGTLSGAGNLISGNGNAGVLFENATTISNTVQGNFIGTNAAGTGGVPNGIRGVFVHGSASNNTIGGTAAGAANIIAFNGNIGVDIQSGTGNSIRGNSIFSNTGLGIDLAEDGVTANDNKDPDTGPNNFQNFPVITRAVAGPVNVIQGTLNSTVGQTFTLDFYANSSCNAVAPNDYGEGQTYLGSVTTTATDANGNVSFTFSAGSFTAGQVITATATDGSGNTSEFSQCFTAAAPVFGTLQFSAANYNDSETNADHTVTITVTRTGGSDGAASVHCATSAGTATAGTDYVEAFSDLNWGDTDSASKTFTVTVKGDTAYEANETVNLTLSAPTNGAALGATNPATLTITNDDAPPATLVVTKTADTNNTCLPGDCSLREAINAANADPDTNTITFAIPIATDPGCNLGAGSCTITLGVGGGVGELSITNNVNINGTGANVLTVSGNNASSVFNISAAVNLTGLTISNGLAVNGGGILNNGGTVNVINCTLSGDSATDTGGGIYTKLGTLNVTNSTISGNPVNNGGGGIYTLSGTVNITNSTISGNSATNAGQGGGIYANSGTLTLTNATVSSNSSGVGGGIFNGSASINLRNTIVAGNNPPFPASGADVNGSFTSQGHNLIGIGDGSTGFTNDPTCSSLCDKVGTLAAPADPKLGALQNYGGPTKTQALLFGSPAIDAGDDCVLTTDGCSDGQPGVTTDQRGVARPQGSHVDIGAFELQTYVVNTTADHDDTVCDASDCTLREAINAANTHPGPDRIAFNIPVGDLGHFYYQDNSGSGVSSGNVMPTTAADDARLPSDKDPDWPHSWWSIQLSVDLGGLPAITDPVFIDGYSQPVASSNTLHLDEGDNAVLRIELNGANLSTGHAFEVTGPGGSTVSGLAINHFMQFAVFLNDAGGNTISGNFIGTDVSGTLSQGSLGGGIQIANGSNDFIGGETPAVRNLISGFASGTGIDLSGLSVTLNVVEGNYIGTDRNGSTALSNNFGVSIQAAASGNTIGCAVLDGDNVISGNVNNGIGINKASQNTVQGNFIGTDRTGTSAIPNGIGIVILDASNNNLGISGFGNVISGNTGDGIQIKVQSTSSNGNKVQGNFIGTNSAGTAAVPNGGDGVSIQGSSSNTIGGANPGEGNVISGNVGEGVAILAGSLNKVQGNFIGVNASGVTSTGMGNGGAGIEIYQSASNNTIGVPSGKTVQVNRNTFAGRAQNAVASPQQPAGAAKRTAANRATNRATNRANQAPVAPSIQNTSAANIIAGNGGDGVRVSSFGDVSNLISQNSIYSNTGLGINLGIDGVTPNDVGDGDPGPNNLQNFPVIYSAFASTGTITGHLNSAASQTFTIELFTNVDCNGTNSPTGYGEGQTYLGSTPVSTDSNGNGTFSLGSLTLTAGRFITATATDVGNNTSEFSQCFTVAATANTNPTITAAAPLSRQQGTAAINGQIATVSDADQPANTLTVTATPLTGSGVTISNISIDVSGKVTADVAASCTATNSTFTLTVTDNASATATDTLTVNVTANTAPVLTYSPTYSVTEGNSLTITPATGPSDNGSVASIVVQSQGTYTGGISVNNSTGVVSISNAAPVGGHTITIRATDNCGMFTDATFTLNVNAAVCTAPPAGMVAWWPGDGNPDDVVGGHNGTLNGGVTFAPGKVDRAFSLNGTNQWVEAPDSPSLRPAALTLDAWINTSDPSATQGIIAKPLATGNWNSYSMTLSNGVLDFQVNNRTASTYGDWQVNFAASANTWYHVAATWQNVNGNSTDAKIYIDGVSQTTSFLSLGYSPSFVIEYNGSPVDLGRTESGNYFKGLIDELEIFNRALGATEVANIYNASFAGKCRTCTPPPSSMVSWWPGQNNANDVAGPNNGTLVGGATFGAGKVGQAFSLNGSTAYVDGGNGPSLQVSSGDFSVDTWVRFDSLGAGDMSLVDKMSFAQTSNGDGWRLIKQTDNRFWFCLGGGNTNRCFDPAFTLFSTTPASVGPWFHVAVTKTSSLMSLYVNGALEDSRATPVFTDTNSTGVRLGSNAFDNAFLAGSLDEVEIFNRSLSGPEIAALADAGNAGKCHTSTIQFAVANTNDTETDSGSHTVNVVVTRNGDHAGAVDVTYTVTDGTATTADGDYSVSPATGPLHWDSGDSSPRNIVVTVNGDTKSEANETVNLTLSNVVGVGASLGTPNPATLTIVNDDAAPTLTINNRTANEGTLPPGTTSFTFTVTRTGSTDLSSTVQFATADDTGGANPATGGGACGGGVDYISQSGVLTFPASGPGSTSQPITILVCKDTVYEPNETFLVNLSIPTNATLGSPSQGVGTITNDDAPAGGFVVNSTADTNDGRCDDPLGTGAGNKDCTLREAINAANSAATAVSISFAIPVIDPRHFYYKDDGSGSPNGTVTLANVATTTAANDATLPADKDPDWAHGWWSILPTSALPIATQSVVIDGYTQTGATLNTLTASDNAVLRIELDGASAGASVTGLSLSGGTSILRGFAINRFTGHGLSLQSGGGNSVTGNFIGTDVSGTLDLGNAGSGISSPGSSMNIGGSAPSDINLISGNDAGGVLLTNSNSNVIQGNLIGTKANGTSALGNGGSGISLAGGASVFNTVGGTNAGEGNTIAFNGITGGDGVRLVDAGVGNSVRGNSIFSNGSTANDLGIDLGADGITPNDAKDPDSGPNNQQNFPIITSAQVTGSTRTITGTLNSNVGQTFTIDFYQNSSCDTSGNGEGKTYLGSMTTAATDSNGDVSFTFHPSVLTIGQFVTATATNSGTPFNTSEFSACFAVANGSAGAGDIQFTSATYTVAENVAGGMAAITLTRVGGSNGSISATFSTSDGTANQPGDYTAVNQVVTFGEGVVSMTVNVPIIDDTRPEANETVNLSLGSTTINAARRDGLSEQSVVLHAAVLTITDNDPCPTVFTVNDNGDASDANPGDGLCATAGSVCTLRAAIEEANALTACGTIDINFSIGSSTITLTNGTLFVGHSVNINGPGANLLTLSGNNTARVFTVNQGYPGQTDTISGLIISGGSSDNGGGVQNSGTLTLTNCVISNSSATQNGGGILNVRSLTITNSTISGNSTSGAGGGIFNDSGTLTLTNSTISGNNSAVDGGGIYNSATATLTNVTISNNRTDSDSNNTGAGGGIFVNGGTFTLKNTIVAGNFKGGSPSTTRHDVSGILNGASSFNLIGDGTGMSGISNGSNGNHVGTSVSPIDPLLAALMNNGGPTFTHGLLYNSPAVDAGDNCVFDNTCNPTLGSALTTDQRGLLRKADGDLTAGAVVDIGAYERQATESRIVPQGSNTHVDLNDVRLVFSSTFTDAAPRDGETANVVQPDTIVGNTVSITVIPVPGDAPPGSGPAFDVTPSSTFYTGPVDVCFYLPSITNQTTFNTLKILHRESGVLADHGSYVNFASKIVCTTVPSFSDFVITHGASPSVTNGTIGGTIADSNGLPISGVTINLGGTQTRETITDAQGNYSFDNIETNGFYTVTPSRANYTFSPPNRSFSSLGVHTEASFTASANGDHANAIDTTEFFVRQQYLDFLGREPDPPGFIGWVNTIRNCSPGDTSCDRVHISEMFFRSQEFQERGYFVYRFYSSALGRKPDYAEFAPDLQRVSGFLTNDQLEAAKTAFTNDFMARPAFAQYNSLSNSAYVDALINTAAVNLSNRQSMVDGLNAGTLTRAQVLRQIAESGEVYQKNYNQAFVVMEYFGYLRRDPDALYLDWIQVLDANPADSRHMVNGFVNSTEYRNRFAQ